MKLKRVVVVTDLGEWGDVALEAGLRLAEAYGVDVDLIFALEKDPRFEKYLKDRPEQQGLFEEARHIAERELQAALARHAGDEGKEGVNATALVLEGKTTVRVVEHAQKIGDSLVVVGAGGLDRSLPSVGSRHRVAKIVRKATCPVLVVCQTPPLRAKQILAAVDDSSLARKVLATSVEIAAHFGGHLTVLHASEPVEVPFLKAISTTSETTSVLSILEQRQIEEYNAIIAGFDFRGVAWDSFIQRGSPAETIVNHVKTNPIDLIVMASHGHHALHHIFLGSCAEGVFRELPCSLLIVRPDEWSH